MMTTVADRTAAIEEANRWIGVETVYDGADEVSRNDVRRKLEVYCYDCPLYTDDAVARAHGYRATPAPVAMIPLWALPPYWSPGDPPIFGPGLKEQTGATHNTEMPMPWKSGLNASSEVEFFEPVYPGDRLHNVHKLVEVKPRKTRLGDGVFLTYETTVTKHSGGEVVAIRRNTGFRYDPDPNAEKPARERDPNATDVSQASPFNPPIDWSRQLRLGEVEVGSALPTYNLWLSYQRIVMSVAVDRMFSGIHHNRDFAREGGLADIIFNTRGYEMLLELTLRQWIGLDGRILKMGPFRMNASGHPGDTLVCGATVSALEPQTSGGRVTLAFWVDSPRGRGTSGEAIVWLPS
jgi:acyl dehydratase